jgi:hypothetical protein
VRAGELLFGAAVLFWLSAASQGWAADDASPRIGRVSVVAGAVQYHSPDGEWADALVNEPIAVGAGLRTAADTEAELGAPGARVALAPTSELRVILLDRETTEIALTSGRIGVHLTSKTSPKTVEIDLPQGGVWLSAPGNYDITAGDAQTPAQIQVFTGKARVGGGLDSSHVAKAAPDWFSDWWRSRDDNADRVDPRPWPGISGIAELGDAGHWDVDAKLGNVWYPSDVSADWVPYRDGVWRFLAPWGWTWIDAAPWGFATSHYGRWARIDDHWGWIPGVGLEKAEYSPAVVAFLGTARYGLSRPGDFGAMPAVAWFPLGPNETIGDGAETKYQNRRFATAIPRAVFAAGLPVADALVDDVPEQRFVDAPVILQSLDIPPGSPPKSPVVAAAKAPKKPEPVAAAAAPAPAVVAAAAPMATGPASPAARQRYVVALRDAPVRPPPREVHKRVRVAAVIVVRPHPLASAPHSPHNRQHLAAARGGA